MSRLRSALLIRAIEILSPVDRRKIIFITILQILIGVLDLLGVIAIGLLGALSVSGLQSSNPENRVSVALEILRIQDLTFQQQSMILGISAAILLVGRTVLSIFFTRKTLFFLSRRGAKISADLISKYLKPKFVTILLTLMPH